jgi:hypothetical protein
VEEGRIGRYFLGHVGKAAATTIATEPFITAVPVQEELSIETAGKSSGGGGVGGTTINKG